MEKAKYSIFSWNINWIYLFGLFVFIFVDCVNSCPTECVCQRRTVDCSYRKLSYVPQNIPLDTNRLELQGNNITVIRQTDFQGLRNLRILQLLENSIHTVESGAFDDLVEMERLRIDRNKLTALPDMLFSSMPNLQRLVKNDYVLSGTGLTTRPEHLKRQCDMEHNAGVFLNDIMKMDMFKKDLYKVVSNKSKYVFELKILKDSSSRM
ncbi:hypothetical protein KUTeg_004730 [Tegillarca granosa]|uniref:LRRNT domain-containing protein n=1 Tax=Tegillarca granosa TaxID=220873 RepID=A0ABQ9FKZ3_TEGGR|nr:hypothetical protein KUTeg_004730 [Tegillarca granosa]